MVRTAGGSLRDRLARELIEDLETAPKGRGRVLLWFDRTGHFARLLASTEADLEAGGAQVVHWQQGESQLDLKLRLLSVSADPSARLIVYLPGVDATALLPRAEGFRPVLWSIPEFRYLAVLRDGADRLTGVRRGSSSILDWLERQGIVLGDRSAFQALLEGGAASPLARFVARHAHDDPRQLPRPLRPSDVLEDLVGDPAARIVTLITDPRRALAEWGEDRTDILEVLRGRFGLRLDDADPEQLVDEAVSALALLEAWDAFGRADDFPFSSRLPRDGRQRQEALGVLRDRIMAQPDAAEAFLRRTRRLETGWTAIEGWAGGRPGLPLTLQGLARSRLVRWIGDFARTEGGAELLETLREAGNSKAPPGSSLHRLLEGVWVAVQLMDAVAAAESGAVRLGGPGSMIAAYTAEGGWWRIDRAYLRFEAVAEAEPDLAPLREFVARRYCAFVATLNEAFWERVREGSLWPPSGAPTTIALDGWVDSGRCAIIVSDALRFDLGTELASRVGPSATVTAGTSTLPTTTPFGMAALLPLEGVRLRVADELQLLAGEGLDLATREGRRRYLTERFASRGRAPRFIELDDLLRGATVDGDLAVVFDYELDDRGHGQGSLPGFVDDHLGRLERAVHRLHELGFERVEVATDHGFLYVASECLDRLGHPELATTLTRKRDPRYAILKPDVRVEELLVIPSPLAPELILAFPRGIATFVRAGPYLHGGVSLQECVVPHIVSVASVIPPRLQVDVRVPTTSITSATVVVKLSPVVPRGQLALGAVGSIGLELWLEAEGEAVSTEMAREELRADTPELTRALYLREGVRLPAGSTIEVRARDRDTGQDLATVPVVLAVDWE